MTKQPTIISIEEGVRNLNYSSLIKNIQNEHCQKELQSRIEPLLSRRKSHMIKTKKLQRKLQKAK